MPHLRHFCDLNHLHYATTSIPQRGIAPASSTRSGLSANSSPRSPDLRGELGFRIVGYVLIPQSGTVTYCSGPRTAPTPPRLCSPLVAQGPRSGPAALPATRLLAAPQTGQSALGLAPRRIRLLGTSRPRRQNHGAVEKPQGWRASLPLHCLSRSSMIQ
jgi:hypothetical protein